MREAARPDELAFVAERPLKKVGLGLEGLHLFKNEHRVVLDLLPHRIHVLAQKKVAVVQVVEVLGVLPLVCANLLDVAGVPMHKRLELRLLDEAE